MLPRNRHRCDVSSELCCPGAKPWRWIPLQASTQYREDNEGLIEFYFLVIMKHHSDLNEDNSEFTPILNFFRKVQAANSAVCDSVEVLQVNQKAMFAEIARNVK